MMRVALATLFLALPVQAQEKSCDKTKASCAEGMIFDETTKACVKVSS